MDVAVETGFELIEQAARGRRRRARPMSTSVPVCADNCRIPARASASWPKHDAVNIKLDKAGGLTEALALEQARAAGLKIMVGCMVATSLAMAPALLLAQDADWVDLDGPLLLARDREGGLHYDGALVSPPQAALWG
jgi:L-alanine-DL-glutamate epimerase-like enolase superfamily enzyme